MLLSCSALWLAARTPLTAPLRDLFREEGPQVIQGQNQVGLRDSGALPMAMAVNRCIYRTKYPNLDLIRGSRDLETLSGPEVSASAIKTALAQVAEKYDYAVIDCHPSMQLPTIAALIAADELLIPCNADAFGREGLDNMIGYLRQITESYINIA